MTEEEKKERKADYDRKYRKANLNKVTAYIKKWALANKDKTSANNKRYMDKNANNPEYRARLRRNDTKSRNVPCNKKKKALRQKTHRLDNLAEYRRKEKEDRDALTDTYVKKRITETNSLSMSDIPQLLIKAKRAHLKGTRLIKEQENERQKD